MGKISNLNAQIPFGKDEENQAGLKTDTAVILRKKPPFALPVFPIFTFTKQLPSLNFNIVFLITF
jgi:hypothetical protein